MNASWQRLRVRLLMLTVLALTGAIARAEEKTKCAESQDPLALCEIPTKSEGLAPLTRVCDGTKQDTRCFMVRKDANAWSLIEEVGSTTFQNRISESEAQDVVNAILEFKVWALKNNPSAQQSLKSLCSQSARIDQGGAVTEICITTPPAGLRRVKWTAMNRKLEALGKKHEISHPSSPLQPSPQQSR